MFHRSMFEEHHVGIGRWQEMPDDWSSTRMAVEAGSVAQSWDTTATLEQSSALQEDENGSSSERDWRWPVA